MQTPSKRMAKYSGQHIRPTADRAREALFSIMGREVEEAIVLDLYAGTGALGLEALSRSARRAVFVDISSQAVQIIHKNVSLCGFSDRTLVLKRDLTKGLSFLIRQKSAPQFSLVFVDPPYRLGLSAAMLQNLAESDILCPEALVVIEEDVLAELPALVGELTLIDQRRYGETGFWLYRQNKSVAQTTSNGEFHGRIR